MCGVRVGGTGGGVTVGGTCVWSEGGRDRCVE